MLTMEKNMIVVGADNRPPMCDKTQYSSWASRMLLYIKGKEHGKLLYDSVINGPFKYEIVTKPETQTTPTTVRDRTYDELTNAEKIREACDIKETNIVLQGLPQDIYSLERESKLNDEFDTFTSVLERQFNLSTRQWLSLTHNLLLDILQPITSFEPRLTQGIRQSSKMEELQYRQFRGDRLRGQEKVVHCYNYQEEGRMARQCTKPKKIRNSAWFKEKMLLAEALESKVVLDEEQMAFLTDNGDTVTTGQVYQELATTAAF
ncbi:hypothetical protein Tco_0729716 [Tanacetum coccineum]|uniref:Uncharacterized protein n=1 Tax=Tanacetum coccineum TaxID=301880 RepID=A0ABQ4YQL3_9ASTR